MDGIRGKSWLKVLAGIALLGAWPALWIGLHDLIAPVSFSSQILGAVFAAGGLLIVTGLLWVICARPPDNSANPSDDHIKHETRVLRVMFFGAVASALVSASVAYSSVHYRSDWVVLFLLVTVVATILAAIIGHSDGFHSLTNAIGSSLLAGGTIVAIASFAYQNLYVPTNTEVGIAFSASLGKPRTLSKGVTLIPVRTVMEDTSTEEAVALSSLVTITGVSYTGAGNKHLSREDAQNHEMTTAEGVDQREPNTGAFDDLFAGHEHRSVLAVTRILGDGSAIFSGTKYQNEWVVAVPRQHYQEIDVHQEVFYAGTDHLALASQDPFHHQAFELDDCPNDVRKEWHLRESALRTFTHGHQILVTDWCAARGHEWTAGFVRNEGGPTSHATAHRNARLYGLDFASHYEQLLLR
jgi:hypothetical protein